MSKYHACVWIDHRQAKIFAIDSKEADKQELHDRRPLHHIHRKADHVDLGKVPIDPELLRGTADALKDARAILILGPGQARMELAGYLNEHHPRLSSSIWGIQPADHPTDAEIVAQARAFFVAANRMHG